MSSIKNIYLHRLLGKMDTEITKQNTRGLYHHQRFLAVCLCLLYQLLAAALKPACIGGAAAAYPLAP